MKTILITAALALAFASPSIAFQRSIEGCEIVQVPGTNYFNLADPTCPARIDGDEPRDGLPTTVAAEEVAEVSDKAESQAAY